MKNNGILTVGSKNGIVVDEYRAILIICLFLHLGFSALFSLVGFDTLAVIDLIAAMIYAILQFLEYTKGYKSLTTYICYFEVIIVATINTVFLGWDYGFYLYIICIIPLIFYRLSNRLIISTILGIISSVVFVFLRIYSFSFSPLIIDNNQFLKSAIYVYNAIIAFGIIMIFPFIFCMNIQASKKKLLEKNIELNKLARIDPLTNLLNRRSMKTKISIAFVEYKKYGKCFAVLLCDIDDFKMINDEFGHDCGDYVLKNISESIVKSVGINGNVCRWGGEEILILLSDIEDDNLEIIAQKVHESINRNSIVYNQMIINPTITIGVSKSDKNKSIEYMKLEADSNIYTGKNSGKNFIKYS